MFYWFMLDLQYYITKICLWLVKKINTSKSRNLSQVLFLMAEDYNTRPGTNNYFTHEGKDCQLIDGIKETELRDSIFEEEEMKGINNVES